MEIILLMCATLSVTSANIFKGSTENFPVTEENAAKVRDALLSVIVSNSAAFSIHHLLTEDNLVFSPLSITNALAMLYLGSKEQTAMEMEDSLGFNSTYLHCGLLTIRESMVDEMEDCEAHSLKFANAMALCSNYSLSYEFEHDISSYYSADILKYKADVEPQVIVDLVNAWVSNVTRGKITDVMPTTPEVDSLTLINSLYFKAPWKYPFDPIKTVKKPFYNFGYQPSDIMIMQGSAKTLYGYHPDIDSYALELPYSGIDADIIFLLPRQRSGLHNLERLMSVDVYNTLHQVMYKTEVEMAVPKFKISNFIEMPHVLKSLGIQSLFCSDADLSGMSPERDLYVSQMIHKTTFDLNEAGTEISTLTKTNVQTLSLKPTFHLNHPFMFIVKHRWTGAILFCGRIQKL